MSRRATVRAMTLAVMLTAPALGGCGGLIGIRDPTSYGDGQTDLDGGAIAIGTDAGTGSEAGEPLDSDLVLWYRFDESTGVLANDSASWGGVARNGTLAVAVAGEAVFSTNSKVGSHSLSLKDVQGVGGGYVVALPSPGLQTIVPGAATFACWVYLGVSQSWQRVFDFGSVKNGVPSAYMFLTTNEAELGVPGSVRFTITNSGMSGEQKIDILNATPLTLNAWHHLAVVLSEGTTSYVGNLYVDGVLMGTNPSLTVHPFQLGATDLNYLGRSMYSSDPFFNGQIDDFRIYRRALSAADISTLISTR